MPTPSGYPILFDRRDSGLTCRELKSTSAIQNTDSACLMASLLIDLALDLSGSWKKLARALGLEDKVERIRTDNENDVTEQAYRMLLAWKQRNGTLATLEVLSEALRKSIVSRRDLAEKYCENNNQGSSKAGKRFRNLKIRQV